MVDGIPFVVDYLIQQAERGFRIYAHDVEAIGDALAGSPELNDLNVLVIHPFSIVVPSTRRSIVDHVVTEDCEQLGREAVLVVAYSDRVDFEVSVTAH
ncbi:hypothetical protein B1L11_03750 [Microbispora sp. GKU 823]|nr:hypothetical protein B1L11_03750 [Microbispora sp. GKU 823]